MKAVKLRSIQRLNTGDWQLIQVLYNEKEMRISVNTISLLFYFDGKSMFDQFQQTVFVGGVPRTIGYVESVNTATDFTHKKLIKSLFKYLKE